MRNMWRLLVCSECGEMDNDETVCGFCESEEGVTMIDVVPADTRQKVVDEGWALSDAIVDALRAGSDTPDPQRLWAAVEAWQAFAAERASA